MFNAILIITSVNFRKNMNHFLNRQSLRKKLVLIFTIFANLSTAYSNPNSVINFGATGNGITDDTKAIQSALNNNKIIYFPKGTYLVSSLIIGDNKKILTDGYSVILKQDNHSIGKQIIRIEGSNVSLAPLTCIGNISTDSSEFNIAIFVVPPFNHNTQNVIIKGLIAKDIRGDGICVGNSGGTYPENVTIENITIENCYRNGISVVGGKNIVIRNVDVTHSGMEGIDIEGEGEKTVLLENISLTNVKAGNICISGGSLRAKKITCSNITLDGKRQKSTPPFRPMNDAGILIYNAEDVTITKAVVKNMPGFAVFVGDIEANQSLLCEGISITDISLQNNALTDKVYKAYMCVMGVHKISVNKLKAILNKEQVLFLGKSNSFAGTQNVTISDSYVNGGKHLAQNCIIEAKNISINTTGTCFFKMQEVTLVNSKIVCPMLGVTTTKMQASRKNPFNKSDIADNEPVVHIINTKINSKRVTKFSANKHSWLL